MGRAILETFVVSPADLGRWVFQKYWLSIEGISLLLFLALLAGIHLGRVPREKAREEE